MHTLHSVYLIHPSMGIWIMWICCYDYACYKTLGFYIWLYISSMANILCQRISHQRFKGAGMVCRIPRYLISIHLVSYSYVVHSPWVERESGTCSLQQNTATVMVGVGQYIICDFIFLANSNKRFSGEPKWVRWPLCRTYGTRNCGQTSHQEWEQPLADSQQEKMGTSVLPPQGTEFCQQSLELKEGHPPLEKALKDTGGYLECSLVKLWADDLIALDSWLQKW